MNNRSRSTLFLIEQLIVIAVFALCAAACARILTSAYFSANESRDLGNALHIAESGAECFKAAGGDIGKVAQVLGGVTISNFPEYGVSSAVVFYDSKWLVCKEDNADYRLLLAIERDPPPDLTLITGSLIVEKLTGDEIIALSIAARQGYEAKY